jgi:hemerythrin
MEYVTWNSKFETGNEKIDFEHRIFFGLIQSFACEMNDGTIRNACIASSPRSGNTPISIS